MNFTIIDRANSKNTDNFNKNWKKEKQYRAISKINNNNSENTSTYWYLNYNKNVLRT